MQYVTEVFDAVDLKDAKALLKEMGREWTSCIVFPVMPGGPADDVLTATHGAVRSRPQFCTGGVMPS
jgi:hypothetical protein